MIFSTQRLLKQWSALRKLYALLLITLTFASLPVQAACEGANFSLGPVIDATTTRPARFDWQGEFLQDDVICYLSRQSGAELRGCLFAPANVADLPDGSLPVVVIGTGSGSAQALYCIWAVRELAGHGYIVLAEDPQGAGRSEIIGNPADCNSAGCRGVPFQSASNFIDSFSARWISSSPVSIPGLPRQISLVSDWPGTRYRPALPALSAVLICASMPSSPSTT